MPTDTTETQSAASLTTDLAMAAPRCADPSPDALEVPAMFHEVVCIFSDATRDRDLSGLFRQGLTEQERIMFAERVSVLLVKRIGARYVRTVDARAALYSAVRKAFTGKNRDEVMRHFRISRRQFYYITRPLPRLAGR